MKKLILLALLLISTTASAAVTKSVQWTEEDGSPTSFNPYKVKVSNGTLTNNGDGTVSVNTAGTAVNSFETINTTSGTAPVADSSTDTLNLTAGSGITITGDSATDTVTIAASGSGDVTTVGDCMTGDCFSGTSGATLTFDTNGGTYGNDAIIAQDQTENYIKLSASGISDGGGNFSPLLYLQSLQTGTSALMLTRAQNGTMANFGAQGGGYLQMMHHPGTGTAGYGIMSYLTEIYPAYFNGNGAAFAQSGFGVQSNNTMSFGTSSYRWANVYSVLGNFSGAVTIPDDAYAAGWDGSATVPTKNAIYDKIQTLTGTIGGTLGASDNYVPRSDGTGGSTLQGSTLRADDSGAIIVGCCTNYVAITPGATYNIIQSVGESTAMILQPASGSVWLGNTGTAKTLRWYEDAGYNDFQIRPTTNDTYFEVASGSASSGTLYINNSGAGTFSLQVEGNTTIGGVLKLTPAASPPGSPASGDIYTDSTASPDELCFYDGAAWQGISSGTDANCA